MNTRKPTTTTGRLLAKHRPEQDQPVKRNRSLLSRSRVHRAIEAARRVGGGLIVTALNVGGLRSGAGAPMDPKKFEDGPWFSPVGSRGDLVFEKKYRSGHRCAIFPSSRRSTRVLTGVSGLEVRKCLHFQCTSSS